MPSLIEVVGQNRRVRIAHTERGFCAAECRAEVACPRPAISPSSKPLARPPLRTAAGVVGGLDPQRECKVVADGQRDLRVTARAIEADGIGVHLARDVARKGPPFMPWLAKPLLVLRVALKLIQPTNSPGTVHDKSL